MTADIDGGEIREPGDDEAPMFVAAPVWERNRTRRATRGHGSPAGSRTALLAGAAVVLGLGFAGAAVLYATQDRGGVPELAPGAPGPVNPPAQAAPAIPQTPPVLPQESAPEIQPPSATPPTAAG
jgi:hypothetical protein